MSARVEQIDLLRAIAARWSAENTIHVREHNENVCSDIHGHLRCQAVAVAQRLAGHLQQDCKAVVLESC